ncbi:hypothetical protein RQ734_19180, partial [Roseomonas mucosa]|uniref:hypothetical protein n=1 Tax=Roseomonas mucosa TaxID=207340 RepID=UPI0028CC3998
MSLRSDGGPEAVVPQESVEAHLDPVGPALPESGEEWIEDGDALLKGSCGFGEEHEVVGQDTQDEFASL